jgi:hypothetical protein
MKLILKLTSAVALVGSGIWFYYEHNFESALTFIASLGTLIGLFVNDEVRRRKALEVEESRKKLCIGSLNRIRKERSNFQRLLENRSYSGAAHKKAVEQDSFECLLWDLRPLNKVWRYRLITKAIIREAERIQKLPEKDTRNLLKLLDKLEHRLDKECGV